MYSFLMYKHYNPNPKKKATGDCIVRAITKITGQTWDQAFFNLCFEGFEMAEMPSENSVWHEYVRDLGFEEYPLPRTCPRCYTLNQFCRDYPEGKYLVATGTHVIAVIDGDYYDAWDSGNQTVTNYWEAV